MEDASTTLAINGGPKSRTTAWPGRNLLGIEEKSAVDALFDQAIESGNAFGYCGAPEEAFCQEFAEMMGGGYADAVNSGTTAVYVALRALELEPFTEVIVGPITDPGGMMPIAMMNCIPVVADCAPGCYNVGPEQIAELISPRTSAIVVAHIAGEPVDMQAVMKIALRHNIRVVEDCAQAHLATLNGKLLGTFGDVAAFSTMFGKHFCTGGQGGVVYTKSERRYTMARWASDRGKPFGLPAGSSNCVASLNYNLNDLSAVIGSVQIKKLPGIIERRRRVVSALADGIAELESISMPEQLPGADPSWWFLRLRYNADAMSCDKQTFCAAVAAEGLPIAMEYRAMPHTMEWFTKRRVFGTSGYPWASRLYDGDKKRQFPCPNALEAIDTHLNLYCHEGWGQQEIDDTLAAFRKVEAAYRR